MPFWWMFGIQERNFALVTAVWSVLKFCCFFPESRYQVSKFIICVITTGLCLEEGIGFPVGWLVKEEVLHKHKKFSLNKLKFPMFQLVSVVSCPYTMQFQEEPCSVFAASRFPPYSLPFWLNALSSLSFSSYTTCSSLVVALC